MCISRPIRGTQASRIAHDLQGRFTRQRVSLHHSDAGVFNEPAGSSAIDVAGSGDEVPSGEMPLKCCLRNLRPRASCIPTLLVRVMAWLRARACRLADPLAVEEFRDGSPV